MSADVLMQTFLDVCSGELLYDSHQCCGWTAILDYIDTSREIVSRTSYKL